MSGTASTRSRSSRYKLKLVLTLAFIVVALVSIAVAAVTASALSRRSVNQYFSQCQMSGPGQHGCAPTAGGALDTINKSFLIASGIAIALGLAMSVVLARELTRPLGELTEAAEDISRGEYSRRVEARGGAELSELATAFNSLAEGLETNEKLRRNMVADISHELRNPLAAIRAQLEAIEDGVLEADHETIASLVEDVDVLARLVDDLQQLSQVESGQLVLERMEVDVKEVLEGMSQRFAPQLESSGVTLTVTTEAGLPGVDADPVRLAQVVLNLVKNALGHTPAGGSMALEAVRAGDMVEISVSDTGLGISKEDLPFVFERFYRSEKARERATGGAGIGLTIARSLVEAHGGSISAESEPGSGTRITFTLPVFGRGRDARREERL